MILFSALILNNNRSKAYIQNLIKNGLIPEFVIVLNTKNRILPEHDETNELSTTNTNQKLIRTSRDADISFDEKEHIIKTLKKSNIKYKLLDTLDANSEEAVKAVGNCKTEYILYSGHGGTILKKPILSLGKKFIHVHPGWLPKYKGSTVIYYSILIESSISCSVIILNEKIDGGPVLYTKKFKITEKNVDFDYVLDPAIRTSTLISFFNLWNKKKIKRPEVNNNNKGNTFYIIHPLLKHFAILKARGIT